MFGGGQNTDALLTNDLNTGSKSVPMEKVMMLIWLFRDDPTVVQFMAQFVTSYASNKNVFDGIEFYLPQLAHMIIHLEANWDDAILERFALVVAQHSLHFALELNWILQGALADYQPELPDGSPNKQSNALYYSRCVKLLRNIEQCIVYGSPRTHELKQLYENNEISKDEYDLLLEADKKFQATLITSSKGEAPQQNLTLTRRFYGTLLYKRQKRMAAYKPKPWKPRYFLLSERMLYCYNKKGGTMNRAMPLEGATIKVLNKNTDGVKYPHMFQVSNASFKFRMRASSEQERDEWVKQLTLESKAVVPEEEEKIKSTWTTEQKQRLEFYQKERQFIADLCDVAEQLRFKERSERKKLAPSYVEKLQIPTTTSAYVPMCNSTDIWRRVIETFPNDTRVFNTKERCPVILYFRTARGEVGNDDNLDVANYLHLSYQQPSEKKDSIETSMEVIDEEKQETSNSIEERIDDTEVVMSGSGLEITNGDNSTRIDTSHHSQGLWKVDSEDDYDEQSGKNKRLQNIMRNQMIRMPSKMSNLMPQRNRKSLLDKGQLPVVFDTVPILEDNMENNRNNDDSSLVSDVSSSILTTEGGILHVDGARDGLTKECLDRAKKIICGDESYAEKTERMLSTRSINSLKNCVSSTGLEEIVGVMAKSNDDLRQEVFVMQMIHFYKSVFAKADLPIWLKTYRILSTSKDCGLIEVLTDSTSIDGLKKSSGFPANQSLFTYFVEVYGKPDTPTFQAAQRNFIESLVGYSLVSYLLGLKDRHNGNIMIDMRGRLIFIDFGFAMGMAPGHEFSMERAAFKLTQDYMDVMAPNNGFETFKKTFVDGMQAARANSQIALGLVEIMMYKSKYPCFSGPRYGGNKAIERFQKRLLLFTPDDKVAQRAEALVE